jgi:VWFA-related protein
MSYSSTFKIDEIQRAAIDFIDQLRTNDRVMVISFDEEVHVLSEPTSDRQKLYAAIMQTKLGSGTSLYYAINFVVNQRFRKIGGRKAIVLFSDGVDTTSTSISPIQNLRDVQEIDTLVYPIHYDTFADVQRMKNQTVIVPPTQPVPLPHPIPTSTPNPFPFPIPTGGIGTPSSQGTSAEDYRRAEAYLNDLANRTGGRVYEASTTGNLTRAFSSIAAELREFYSVGYYLPEGAEEGRQRAVTLPGR